ncbi:hypothetical protein [Rhizobium halophytocola]|uniref:Uncharacterized protein n=1 Tax=Rhizobium halophytocola TaxID=735519 RepID=A0ABS4DYV5_9HYPH|nr:hypothetical protein [Rhizobium halophytocola]MBP1850869.1 hypothetical protein [Rhizobium halophytocola]
MTTSRRPIHCNFGSLRHAGERVRLGQGHHSGALATHEQLTARAFSAASRVSRPSLVFTDFRSV